MSAPAAARRELLVALDNVTVGYDQHPAIHHLQVQIHAGDMLAVVGPNGAGKSTFLKLLTGERLSLEGEVHLPDERLCRVAYLPQISQTDRQFPITVQDMVASGLWHQCGAFGRLGREGAQRVALALDMVGLRDYAGRVISALSGGEFQRVRFAQLILQDARMVVLDEPFVGIDVTTQQVLLDLLARWHAQGTTIVAALHEQDIVRQWFPSTLLLAREMIAVGPTQTVLTPANWQRAVARSVAAREPSNRWCEGMPASGLSAFALSASGSSSLSPSSQGSANGQDTTFHHVHPDPHDAAPQHVHAHGHADASRSGHAASHVHPDPHHGSHTHDH